MRYDEPGREPSSEPSSGIPAAVLENVFDDPRTANPAGTGSPSTSSGSCCS